MKQKKKITVTIGIPAYNEEKNIKNAIESILSQKSGPYTIVNIIVALDACTDNTENIVKSINNKKIVLLKGKTRKGKSFRLNQIFKMTESELLILLDADCIAHKNAINQIVRKHISKHGLGVLVGSKSVPVNVNTHFTKVIASGVEIGFKVSKKLGLEKSVYPFRGALMGISKDIYKGISMPSTAGTDAFLYFYTIKKGHTPTVASRAYVYYRLPLSYYGHYKQSSRFINSKYSMKKIFGSWVVSHYKLPKKDLALAILNEMTNRPVYTSIYIFLNIYIAVKARFKKKIINGIWDIAKSTKPSIYR